MRKAPLLLLLLLLLATLTSCRRDASFHAALTRAEALMESDPHAARAVLDSLDLQSSISNLPSKDAADYAWLKVQTDYKCDVPLTTDSLARIATDYYGTPRRRNYHAAMAWYTLGCAYGDLNDDVNATDAFLNAKSLFPDTLIRYYALAEQKLGTHHLKRHMTHEAAQEFHSSKQNLIRLGDSTAVAFLDLSLARCCLYREEYASAKEWLERVIHNPHAGDFVVKASHFEMAKVEAYHVHDYAKAHEYLDYNICHTIDKSILSGVYGLKAVAFQEQGKLDSAWCYYHRSLSCRPDYASLAYDYRQMAVLAPQLSKADSIAYYVRLYHTYIDSLYIISNQQTIRQVENDHRVEMEQQRMENEHRRMLIVGIAVLVIVCLILWTLFLYHRNRNNRKTIALQEAIRQSNVVLMNLTVPAEEERESTSINAEALANPDAYISLFRLGKNMLDAEAVEKLKKLNAISGGTEADSIRQNYEAALDHAFVELMMMLKLVSPSLNKQDLQYIISRMLGIDDKLIQVIQNTYDSTFRMRRNRLNKKLPDGIREKLLSPVTPVAD